MPVNGKVAAQCKTSYASSVSQISESSTVGREIMHAWRMQFIIMRS
jgi:hypothetical protein